MGSIVWTPAVQEALSIKVINSFGEGFTTARVSDLMQICGPGNGAADADKYVAIIVGKDFAMELRERDSDERNIGGVNLYESRAEVANYQRWIWLTRHDALFDKIGKLAAIAAAVGASAAEQPSRMVEAVVPIALEAVCHTGQPFFDDAHPVKPGSSDTFANMDDLGDLDIEAYDEAQRQLAQIPDEDGRASGAKGTVLAVGRKWKEIARDILMNRVPLANQGGENQRTGDGTTLVVVDDWPSTFWGLFDTTAPTDRPFHYCEAVPFTVRPIETDPNGPYAIKHNRIEWAVDGYAAMVLGNPRRAFLSVADASVATVIANAKAKMKLNKFDFSLI